MLIIFSVDDEVPSFVTAEEGGDSEECHNVLSAGINCTATVHHLHDSEIYSRPSQQEERSLIVPMRIQYKELDRLLQAYRVLP